MVKAETYPAEINSILNEVKLCSKRIRSINDKCRKVNDEEQYQEHYEKVKTAKSELFQYCTDNDLEKVGDYSLEWLKPADVKKDERNETSRQPG